MHVSRRTASEWLRLLLTTDATAAMVGRKITSYDVVIEITFVLED